MSKAKKKRDKHVTFRTYTSVDKKIDELAARVKENMYKFYWNTPMRKCTSKSGLIHEVLSENISIDEIKYKLKKIEELNDESN